MEWERRARAANLSREAPSGLGGSRVSSQAEDGGRKPAPATLTRRDALKRISLNAAKAVSFLVLAPGVAGAADAPEIMRYASVARPGAAEPAPYPDYASYGSAAYSSYGSAAYGSSASSAGSAYDSLARYRDSGSYSSYGSFYGSYRYSSTSYFSQAYASYRYSSYYTSYSYSSTNYFGYHSYYRTR